MRNLHVTPPVPNQAQSNQIKPNQVIFSLNTMSAQLSSPSIPAFPPENPVGEFAGHAGIGSPKLPGAAGYDAARQQYTLTAAASNPGSGRDEFHFLWKKVKGDFLLRARADFIGQDAGERGKIGWMARASLEPDAPYAACARHGAGLASFLFRRGPGAVAGQAALPVANPDVLQLERKGAAWICSAARYGEPFVSGQPASLDLGDEVCVGLFLGSPAAGVIEKAAFRDVRVIKPARADFVPYQDYLGSVLEILDVQSGRLEAIYSSRQPFEAPNWTRDGGALIYNLSGRDAGWGRLCRFDLATRKPSFMDTGPARHNNNDHVLSFDGAMLGISDQSAFHGGQSAIFTLPATGGSPRPVTRLSPSYLHGWSPDGKFLVFTGGRNGKLDIYKIASDGSGGEIRLTDAPGLNDGPEYTPDGQFIYFNSSRAGRMQLWRMKPDGTAQEQITHDAYNNWFPHISPDGQWIAFLSFPGEIEPADHPYYKQVYLRLMPAAGGPARVIAYVYGGQGTMNVPSWSPDSQHLAFVSNSDMP
jgi:hypothetical protein